MWVANTSGPHSTVVQMVKSGELGISVRDKPNKCIISVWYIDPKRTLIELENL